MTEKTIRWFEGFPEVIKRGEEQDGFFLALAATLASEVPFAEIEEPEMAEEVENQLEEEPAVKRTWQPDPSWHAALGTPKTLSQKDLVEIEEYIHNPQSNIDFLEPLADDFTWKEQLTIKTDEEYADTLRRWQRRFNQVAETAVRLEILTKSHEAGAAIHRVSVWNRLRERHGLIGLCLVFVHVAQLSETALLDNKQLKVEHEFDLDVAQLPESLSTVPATLQNPWTGLECAKLRLRREPNNTFFVNNLSLGRSLSEFPNWKAACEQSTREGTNLEISLFVQLRCSLDHPTNKKCTPADASQSFEVTLLFRLPNSNEPPLQSCSITRVFKGIISPANVVAYLSAFTPIRDRKKSIESQL
ncbi:hypothetical protein KC921_01685 [Candidatus Woesebacteria bacterium]|nr:hypothetical protein [Candidatus Woesebacteria bacterium]